jgi:hypothetical protein
MRIIGLLSVAMLLLNPFQNQLSDKNKGRDDCPTPTGFFILTNAQVNPDENGQVIRAFIPTGSKSPKCLATMTDTNNFAYGTVLFCGEREPAGLNGKSGIWVSIFFPEPVVPDLVMGITVQQEDAKFYGTPVLCTGTNGCFDAG